MNPFYNVICGYCGAPIELREERDTLDLERYDHIATPCDWGFPERRATRWHHTPVKERKNGRHPRRTHVVA